MPKIVTLPWQPLFMKEKLALFAQFAISTGIGCYVFWLLGPDHPNPKVPLFGGLIAGFFGGWGVMFLYVWARYGWRAARSLKWDGN